MNIFEQQKKEKGIEVRFEDGDLWLTQKAMSKLYDCSSDNIGLHLKNYFEMSRNQIEEKLLQNYDYVLIFVQKPNTKNIYYEKLLISIIWKLNM